MFRQSVRIVIFLVVLVVGSRRRLTITVHLVDVRTDAVVVVFSQRLELPTSSGSSLYLGGTLFWVDFEGMINTWNIGDL